MGNAMAVKLCALLGVQTGSLQGAILHHEFQGQINISSTVYIEMCRSSCFLNLYWGHSYM